MNEQAERQTERRKWLSEHHADLLAKLESGQAPKLGGVNGFAGLTAPGALCAVEFFVVQRKSETWLAARYEAANAIGNLDKLAIAFQALGVIEGEGQHSFSVPIHHRTPASSGPAASAPPAPPPAPPKPLSLAQQLAQISPLDGLARAKFMQANEAGLKRELREQEAEQLHIQNKNNR